MNILFKKVPSNFQKYISIDNKSYLLVNDNQIDIPISKGKHTLTILCKSKKEMKYRIAFLSKKNPHIISLNISIRSFEQKLEIWVKRDGNIELEFITTLDKNFFNCLIEKNLLTCNTTNVIVNSQEYFPVSNKSKYAILQVVNILLAMLPFLCIIIYHIVSELLLIPLPLEEWIEEYYFPKRLRPMTSLLIEGTIEIVLFLFFLIKHIKALRRELKTIKDQSKTQKDGSSVFKVHRGRFSVFDDSNN